MNCNNSFSRLVPLPRSIAKLALIGLLVAWTTISLAEFRLAQPEWGFYYSLSMAAGGGIQIHGPSEIQGDVYSGGDIDLHQGSHLDGDATAVGQVQGQGSVSGQRLEGVEPIPMPFLDENGLRQLADRIFDGNTTWDDATVDDIVFIDGTLRVRGILQGSGTVIASRDIRLDAVEGAAGGSGAGTCLSLIAFDDIRIGKDRALCGVLRAGRDVALEKNVAFDGVIVADRKIQIDKDSRIRFLSPDTTPPTIADTTPDDGAYLANATPRIAASFSDDLSGIDADRVQVFLNGNLSTEADVTAAGFELVPPNAVAEGVHGVEVVVFDHAGLEGRDNWSFVVDVTPPTLTIDAPEPLVVGDTTPLVRISYSDATSGVDPAFVEVAVDSLDLTASCAVSETSAECESPELEHGLHQVAATVADKAGNTSTVSLPFELLSDVQPPTISVRQPRDIRVVNESQPTVVVDYGDDTSGVDIGTLRVRLDGRNLTSFCEIGPSSASCLSHTLEAGSHAISAEIQDRAGNTGSSGASFELAFDTEPPAITITAPDGDFVTGPSAPDLEVTFSDPNGEIALDSLRVLVDGLDQTPGCSVTAVVATCPFPEIGRGVHEITAEIADAHGNVATAVRGFTLDFPLDVMITEPAEDLVTSRTSVRVAGTVSANAQGVRVQGIAASVTAGSFAIEELELGEGVHTLTAVAEDADGNTGIAARRVTVDLTPPSVNVLWPPEDLLVRESTISVQGLVNDLRLGTVNDPEVTVRVNSVSSGGFKGGRGSVVAVVENRGYLASGVPLVPGNNTLSVVATDRAGNQTTLERRVIFREPLGESAIFEVSGNHQAAPIRSELPEPLVVRVQDLTGQPLAGERVIFRIVRGDGTLEDGQRAAVVTTDAEGQASMRWQLGSRAGVGANRVRATAVGIRGEVSFTARSRTTEPDRVYVTAGNHQRGAVGRPLPLPLEAVVLDQGNNPVSGVSVTFQVTEGGGHFDGAASVTVETDMSGIASTPFHLGGLPGFDNNFAAVSFEGMRQRPTIFKASGLLFGDPEDTTVLGVVLDPQDQPVAGATVRIAGMSLSTVSDASGRFHLTGVLPGRVSLEVDASAVSRPGTWSSLELELMALPGVENTLEKPVYILPLDVDDGLFVDEETGGVLTLAEIPGFALEIEPGSVTFPGGSRSGVISVTVVKNDKIPMAPGSGMQPRLIVTVQPSGAEFDPPARIRFPNVDGLPAGTVNELFSFDHELGDFVAIGTATVREDRTELVSDPGFGIVKAGWHCGSPAANKGDGSGFDVKFPNKEPINICLDDEDASNMEALGKFTDGSVYGFSVLISDVVDITNVGPPICNGTAPSDFFCKNSEICESELTPKRVGTTLASVELRCCPTGHVVTDDININVVEIDIEIYSGQNGNMVPDAEEETVGAFTVANLNDTDGDGKDDWDDDDVVATEKGRDEVDLMKLVIQKPKPEIELGKKVKLTIEGPRVRLWEGPTKGTEIAVDGRSVEFETRELPKTIWVEALEPSNEVRDFELTAEYICARDTVKASAVWAELTAVAFETQTAAELLAKSEWSTMKADDPARGLLEFVGSVGLRPIDRLGILNVILMKFNVLPNKIWLEPDVKFDITRQLQGIDGTFDTFPAPFLGNFCPFPIGEEEVNDDDTDDEDESVAPNELGEIFVIDGPGLLNPNSESLTNFIIQDNFMEFVRVRFDGDDPSTPDTNVPCTVFDPSGSRCSDKFDWNSNHSLMPVDGKWERADPPTGYIENRVGPGHRELIWEPNR